MERPWKDVRGGLLGPKVFQSVELERCGCSETLNSFTSQFRVGRKKMDRLLSSFPESSQGKAVKRKADDSTLFE